LEFRKLDLNANDGEECNKHLGKLQAKQNRCIVFTNEMQHRVMEFEQLKEGLGTRKMISFDLIDPSVKILSTKHVR